MQTVGLGHCPDSLDWYLPFTRMLSRMANPGPVSVPSSKTTLMAVIVDPDGIGGLAPPSVTSQLMRDQAAGS